MTSRNSSSSPGAASTRTAWEAGGFRATAVGSPHRFYLEYAGPHGRHALVVDPDDTFGPISGLTPGGAVALIRYTAGRDGREDIEIEGLHPTLRQR